MVRYKFLSLLCVLVLLISKIASAQPLSKNDSLLLKVKQELYQVEHAPDSKPIEQVKHKLERLVYLTKKKWLARYHLAHAYKMLTDRQMGSQDEDAQEKAENYLNEAEELLKKSLKEKKDFSDGYALLGYICSQKIGLNPSQAMTLSKISKEHYDKSLEINKENPRTHLFIGIAKFYSSFMFEHGIDSAMKELKIAEKKFQMQTKKETLLPSWGYDEVYRWMGIIEKRKGDRAQARSYYNKAIKINPHNNLVKGILLPSLGR